MGSEMCIRDRLLAAVSRPDWEVVVMGYASYVGRVGGLAVALGVGVAVATTPGVAWAGPSDTGSTGSSSSDSASSDSSSSPKDSPKDSPTDSTPSDTDSSSPPASSESSQSPEQGGDSTAGSEEPKATDSGGVGKKSTTAAAVEHKKSGADTSTAAAPPKKPKRPVVTTQSGDETSEVQSATAAATPAQPTTQPVTPPSPAPKEESVADVAPAPINVTPVPQVETAPESEVTPLTANLLSAVGLAPSADGDTPEVPGESPLLLAGLAAFRRQTQQESVEDAAFTKTAADPSQSSLMMAAAANSAPTVDPLVGAPDQTTGAVQVSLHASDADGNPLSYAVTGVPTGGTVEALGNGEFRYTPTVASRLAAATTSTPDFDSFTVSVSDGQGGVTPVSITVPKLPAVWANQASASNVTGSSPAGVAMVGDLAYVANQGTNTVTVVNTKTGAVVGNPIQVGTAPTGVLANANGTRVYVTNRTSGTVSVIRTSDNTVIGSVKVGTSPESMAFNSAGTRLYVANYGSSDVSCLLYTSDAADE